MKYRFIRIAVLLVMLWYLPSLLSWYRSFRESVDQQYPNLSQAMAARPASSSHAPWSPAGRHVQTHEWMNRRGALMGQVSLRCWQDGGLMIYEVIGPLSPEYASISPQPAPVAATSTPAAGQTPPAGTLLEAIYQEGSGFRIERFGTEQATVSWSNGTLESGKRPLPTDRYQIQGQIGRVRIVFSTPVAATPGNLVFHYREGGEVAWIATEHPDTQSHFQPYSWTLKPQGNPPHAH